MIRVNGLKTSGVALVTYAWGVLVSQLWLRRSHKGAYPGAYKSCACLDLASRSTTSDSSQLQVSLKYYHINKFTLIPICRLPIQAYLRITGPLNTVDMRMTYPTELIARSILCDLHSY
ncbi:hypothetical protein B0J17DRAFT_670417 [Rhizoctonia solani]|nr:hypothetical protein B0J17DRAFT_670417 [Rhizoctonia solani]